MTIKVWNYLAELEREEEEILAAVRKVLRSGQLIMGDSVSAFEHEFSAYCGLDFGIGVASGTDALFLALKTLGVKEGDEVITPSFTAVPTIAAIVSAGAHPVFVDIDADTFLLASDKIEAQITSKTKCLLPVHLFGQCCDMQKICAIAKDHNLSILEDCAQSHGASQRGQRAGSFGSAAAYSFYPTKILGGFGDGGMICTNSAKLAASARRLRFYGMEEEYRSLEHGYNSRLDEIHAEILRHRLKRLEGYLVRRREIAERYEKLLTGTNLTLPKADEGNEHSYYLYVCRHKKRNEIIGRLREEDIQLNASYRFPVHSMPAYSRFHDSGNPLPETEKAAAEVFSLPMCPSLTKEEQTRVCQALCSVLAKLD